MIDPGGRDHKEKKSDPRGTAPALVKAPAPELPKGGGAIRGIGEKFSANVFTGTGGLSVPIAVTPGRSGFQPDLSLTYDSGGGNGPFGLGWRLSVPNITRKTDKRLPEYRDAEGSDVYILSGSEDLVPVLDPQPPPPEGVTRYRPRVEGLFARIERHEIDGDVHWVSITPANVRNVYGRSPDARIADGKRIFTWLLERSEDSLGNVIAYEYVAEDLANVPVAAAEAHRLRDGAPGFNRYLKRIRYGNTVPGDAGTCVFQLVFDYGEHDAARPTPERAPGATWPARLDPFSTYRAGFEVRTYRLCRRVLMFHTFPELPGDGPCLVRALKLTYDERPTLTRLAVAVQEGYIRADDNSYSSLAMPPLTFGYGEAEIHTDVREIDAADLSEGVDGKVHQWVDLDGEGIPGVVTDDGGALWYRRNLGGGALERPRRLMIRPTVTALARGGQQLQSLGGDGRLDLVELGPPLPGYHERIPPGDPSLPAGASDDGGWAPFRPFASHPQIQWTDPNVRFIDLDGDGLDDVLIAGDDVFTWYPSLGRRGYGPPRTFPRPRDDEQGPAVVFADASHTLLLADLSGDGLRDLVRVGNGNICYWPNLGHGRFGAKVTMSSPPVFDRPDQFQPSRILFADIDGSGNTDIIYVGREGVRFWFNQAGNGWGEAQELPGVRVDSAAGITAVDMLGSGTACLVWSSPLPADDPGRLRYVDLLGSKKPHLIEEVDNNLGFTTRLRYASSTKSYLADRMAGKPWATRLPFPVHVLERVETHDAISGVRFVSEYRYRDGYYDGHEREFRGFGYVEQWDTESDPALSGKGLFADRPPPVNGELPQPPVVTQTWLHTGAWLHTGLPDGLPSRVPGDVTPAELRDAYRALKGQVLRTIVRAEDGTPLAPEPYSIKERGCDVTLVQRAAGDAPAVFHVHVRETLERHTERNPRDARVSHSVTVEVDDLGHVRRAVALSYPRRAGAPDWRPEQGVLLATLTETDIINETGREDWYRHGMALETRTYQLTGLTAGPHPFTFQAIVDAADGATAIAYDDVPGAGLAKRLIERTRTRYYDSNALPAPLSWGEVDARALVYESYGLAFTPRLVSALYGDHVTDAILEEGGYIHLDDDDWWAPSGRAVPDPPFYVATAFRDPFRLVGTVTYDAHWLLPVETRDIKDNVVRIDNDYRPCAPRLITDANGNRTSVALDPLGRVISTRVMGKAGSSDGDPDGEPTTKLHYAFYDGNQPSIVHAMVRETHGDPTTRWQHSYAYSDGSGHEVMKKVQAEPERGTATPRWVGTGRTVFDNKGNPIKKYEPFFAPTPDYETDEDLVHKGVTPILHYDPLGRLILTESPDGTTARVVFTPWRREGWDADDTILDPGNLWYAEHAASTDSMQRRAAALAARNAGTPTVTLLDTFGRDFVAIADNGADGRYETRSELDIEGNPLAVWDALGRAAMTTRFSLLGQTCHTSSIDAGDRWTLVNVVGAPLRSWDALDNEVHPIYDELQRPVELRVRVRTAGPHERIAERTEYGESAPDPAAANLRGRVVRQFDGAGVVIHERYDFKGNATHVTRQLARRYDLDLDWSIDPPPPLEDELFTHVSEFDALDRITLAITPDASRTRPSYNEAGLLDRVVAVVQGTERTYVDNIEYDEKAQRLKVDYAEGAHSDYRYDPRTFRLSTVTTTSHGDGTELQHLLYTYDPAGNIIAIRDEAVAETYFDGTVTDGTALYEYDAIHRLIHVEGREQLGGLADIQRDDRDLPAHPIPHPNDGQAVRPYAEDYRYDPVGNFQFLRHTAAGAAAWTRRYRYVPGSNRLVETSMPGDPEDADRYGATYPHDANGNMTAMPHLRRIDWTFKNEMRRVDLLGGGMVHFVYNSAGRRVRKVWDHGGIVEERIYLGDYEIYRRRENATPALERRSLHLKDGARRIALIETKTLDIAAAPFTPTPRVRFQLGNHLGSAALEIDHLGAVISYEEYHPFGTSAYRAAAGNVDVSPKRYRYLGNERDEETGLDHHGARSCAPWLGRWTSTDPAGLVDGPNLYAYARDNPIRLVDPGGRQAANPDNDVPGWHGPDPDWQRPDKPPVTEKEEMRAIVEAVKQFLQSLNLPPLQLPQPEERRTPVIEPFGPIVVPRGPILEFKPFAPLGPPPTFTTDVHVPDAPPIAPRIEPVYGPRATPGPEFEVPYPNLADGKTLPNLPEYTRNQPGTPGDALGAAVEVKQVKEQLDSFAKRFERSGSILMRDLDKMGAGEIALGSFMAGLAGGSIAAGMIGGGLALSSTPVPEGQINAGPILLAPLAAKIPIKSEERLPIFGQPGKTAPSSSFKIGPIVKWNDTTAKDVDNWAAGARPPEPRGLHLGVTLEGKF